MIIRFGGMKWLMTNSRSFSSLMKSANFGVLGTFLTNIRNPWGPKDFAFRNSVIDHFFTPK
jgi:hypothetical protein